MPQLPVTSPPDTDATPANDDRARFTRLQNDDRDALKEIMTAYQQVTYWTAYSILKSQPDSEEIAADTFITLWNKRHSIVLHGESAIPWLVTTCRFLAKNRARSIARHPASPLDNHEREAHHDDFTNAADLTATLTGVVSSLRPIDAQIYRLCLENGLSYQDAAETLGVSHATVRNRLSRLRRSLQSTLRPHLFDQDPS